MTLATTDYSGTYLKGSSEAQEEGRYSKELHATNHHVSSSLRIRHRSNAIQPTFIWISQVSTSLGRVVVPKCR
jgi:hypothetical protein